MDYIRFWSSNNLNMGVVGIGYEEGDNKWVFIHNPVGFFARLFSNRKDLVILLGNLSTNNPLITTSLNNTIESFQLEDELETAVDNFVNEPGYYKNQAENIYIVEDESDKYLGISEKYTPIEPEPPSPEIE